VPRASSIVPARGKTTATAAAARQAGVALTAHLAAFSRPDAVAILPQVSPPATPQTELQPGTPGKPSAGGAVVVGNWASACVKHHWLACWISVQT